MTKDDFIIQSVLSMNKAGDISPEERVGYAIYQLEKLVKAGVIFSEIEEDTFLNDQQMGGTLAWTTILFRLN